MCLQSPLIGADGGAFDDDDDDDDVTSGFRGWRAQMPN